MVFSVTITSWGYVTLLSDFLFLQTGMRKIGADKIYTDSWLSINFLEKLNVTFFLNQSAAIFS